MRSIEEHNDVLKETERSDHLASKSELDIGSHKKVFVKKLKDGRDSEVRPKCENCRVFEKEYYASESERIALQQEVNQLNDMLNRMKQYQEVIPYNNSISSNIFRSLNL